MDDYKGPGNGNIQGSYVNDDEFVDRHGGPIEVKYMGTAADAHDMSVLGRDQLLRVSILDNIFTEMLSVDNITCSATFASYQSLDFVVPSSARGRLF